MSEESLVSGESLLCTACNAAQMCRQFRPDLRRRSHNLNFDTGRFVPMSHRKRPIRAIIVLPWRLAIELRRLCRIGLIKMQCLSAVPY